MTTVINGTCPIHPDYDVAVLRPTTKCSVCWKLWMFRPRTMDQMTHPDWDVRGEKEATDDHVSA